MPALMGVDLSTRATAVVACPLNWGGDWRKVTSEVFGSALTEAASDNDRVARLNDIHHGVKRFAHANNVSNAFFESYAFSQRTAAHTLGEVGGVVKIGLNWIGVMVHTANMSTARKLLLGKVPKKDPKKAVEHAIRSAGGYFETLDEYDAFTALNLGLSYMGGYFFGMEQPG